MQHYIDIPNLIRTLENDPPSSYPREVMRIDGLFWRIACTALATPSEWLSQTYFLDGIQRQWHNGETVDPPPFTTAIPAEFFSMLFGKGYTLLTATHSTNCQGSYAAVVNPLDGQMWTAYAPTVPQAACAAFLKAICGNMIELDIPD